MLLTTDAAHKHDASPPQSPSPSLLTANGSFLVQMPLSIIGSFIRGRSPSPSPASGATNETGLATGSQNAATPKHAMSAPPDTPLATPVPSRPASSSSSAVDEQPKKRAARSKTSYIYARPPKPVECRGKLHIRPKVLLQLHQIIPSQRPKPAYELVPFPLLPAKSTRRLARSFNTRERLGAHDLLIVKAEAYGKDEEATSDDDRWSSREVVGVICPARNEKCLTEICMDDGTSRWEVSSMPNGGFEFNTTDDHGLTLKARWVPKPVHSRRASAMSATAPLSPTLAPTQDDRKYTFSTITANSRRHPIVATMTQNRIDIMDSYAMPSATSPSTPGSILHSPIITPASIDLESFMSKDQMAIVTDDALRRFIVVTGVWVAAQKYYSAGQPPTPSQETSAVNRPSSTRTVSMSFLDPPRSASPVSTLEENRRTLPRLLRSGIDRLPRSTSFTADPSLAPVEAENSPNSSPSRKTRSRRANSTGNTNLFTMSGSMRRRHGLAFEGQPLAESEEERQIKRSVELLRIKELVLPDRPSSDMSTRQTVMTIPSPIITRPSNDSPAPPAPLLSPPLLSPPLPDPERSRKTQSTYEPVTTTGLWDSGVTERPGLRSRPTSMFVANEKKKRQDRKRERSKTKEDRKLEKERGRDDSVSLKKSGDSDWRKFKNSLKDIFRRSEKA